MATKPVRIHYTDLAEHLLFAAQLILRGESPHGNIEYVEIEGDEYEVNGFIEALPSASGEGRSRLIGRPD